MGVIPNTKMAFIFPISCILVLIFPIFMINFPKWEGKGSFPKSQINHCLKIFIIHGSGCPFARWSDNICAILIGGQYEDHLEFGPVM